MKYLTAVKNLDIDAPKLTYEVKALNNFYEIKLFSENLVKNLFIDTDLEYNFSDNYFDLRPNEQKVIRIKRDKFHSLNSFKESLNFFIIKFPITLFLICFLSLTIYHAIKNIKSLRPLFGLRNK